MLDNWQKWVPGSAVGHGQPSAPSSTREALRRRFRNLKRPYDRLIVRNGSLHTAPVTFAPYTGLASERNANFLPLFQGSYAMSTRVGLALGVNDVDEVVASWQMPAALGDNRLTPLDVSLRLDREGPQSFFELVMDYWARRHDVVIKPGSPDKRPNRRRAIDRLFQALMRYVFGFFGSHKVDARTNP